MRLNSALTIAIVAGLFPLVLSACSSHVREVEGSARMYEPDELDQFVAENDEPVSERVEPEYVLGVGDKLDVVFLFHNNLTTRDLMVRRDGRISLPYIGDQMAAGVTPMTLDSLLTVRFSDILREPNISVIVRDAAPQKIFVLGEVRSPGKYQFDEEVSVLQSVATAGGLERSASAEHAVLIRRQGMDTIVGVEIDLKAIMVGAAMQNDIRLRNYDIVYVPKRPLYSAAEFMQAVKDIVLPPLDIVFRGWQIAATANNFEFFRTSNVTSSP